MQTLLSVRACTHAWALWVRAFQPGAGGGTAVVHAVNVLMLRYFPDTYVRYWSLQLWTMTATHVCDSSMRQTCRCLVHKPVVVHVQGAGTSS